MVGVTANLILFVFYEMRPNKGSVLLFNRFK